METFVVLLFLIILPGSIGACLHCMFVRRPGSVTEGVLVHAAYWYSLYWLSFFLKFWRGHGKEVFAEAFPDMETTLKYATVNALISVAVPLALSLVLTLVFTLIHFLTGKSSHKEQADEGGVKND